MEKKSARHWLSLALGLMLLATLAAPVQALKKVRSNSEELFNPLLGVEYSHWLVGPIYEMASDQEVQDYELLTSDEDAASFIETFWNKRNEGTEVFKKTPQQIFDARAEKADSRYSEATFPGRLTDRGTVYILFGEPEEIVFEASELLDGPPLEVWKYAKDASMGLNGEKPKKQFRFTQLDGKTAFFNARTSEREAKKRQRRRPRF